MQVDLRQLRSQLEKELQELEQRRSALQEQLVHIESVERMAGGTGEKEDQTTAAKMSESGDPAPVDEGKSWFRR